MASIPYSIVNTTNISAKITALQNYIPSNLTITPALNSITYDSVNLIITFNFATDLDTKMRLELDNLVKINIEEQTVGDLYPTLQISPRVLRTTRTPGILDDNKNGYTPGDISINVNDYTAYICRDNSTGAAIWAPLNRPQFFMYNSGGSLVDGSFISVGSMKTVESDAQILITQHCVINKLFVALTAAPGIGNSRTFTARLNGVATALTTTIVDNNQNGSDSTHSFDAYPGDLVSIIHTVGGTPVAATGIITHQGFFKVI